MNIRDLFRRSQRRVETQTRAPAPATSTRLDLDSLENCVGGRADLDGVGCYLQSTQTRVH